MILFFAPLIPVAVIAVCMFAITWTCRLIFPRHKEPSYTRMVASRPNAMDAWCAVYTQSSNADLEISKFYIAINTALVVGSTAALQIWPGTHAPITALITSIFGFVVSALPLAGRRDEHQRRLAVIARCLTEAGTDDQFPFVLPSAQRTKLQVFADNAALVFISATMLILVLHAAITASLCKDRPSNLMGGNFVVCAPAKSPSNP